LFKCITLRENIFYYPCLISFILLMCFILYNMHTLQIVTNKNNNLLQQKVKINDIIQFFLRQTWITEWLLRATITKKSL
jgi:hypothetical protein